MASTPKFISDTLTWIRPKVKAILVVFTAVATIAGGWAGIKFISDEFDKFVQTQIDEMVIEQQVDIASRTWVIEFVNLDREMRETINSILELEEAMTKTENPEVEEAINKSLTRLRDRLGELERRAAEVSGA